MPPIQQQQTSRGGLITALVITIVMFIGALVAFIMNNADLTKLQNDHKTQASRYETIIPTGMLPDADNIRIGFSPSADQVRGRPLTLIEAANEQRNALVKLITGKANGTEKEANDAVVGMMDTTRKNEALKGATLPYGDGLVAVINALASQSTNESAAIKKANDQQANAQKSLEAAIEAHKAELAKRDAAIEELKMANQKLVADTTAAQAEATKQVADQTKVANDATQKMGEMQAAQVTELQNRDRAYAELTRKYDAALIKISQVRPNIKEAVIRNVDAVITQTSPDSICYINLGFGDHVTPGTTFEVYPKEDGVPKLADGTDTLNMPKGKASIEIISVGQNSSQCRVIRTSTGTTLTQGDLCVNIVYDKNIKPYFYVYGKFDMDQNGVATDGEAEILKNLVTRWGGKISEKISIETDFVVLGKEPSIPVFTPEELAQPILKQKADEAKAQLDAYTKIRDEAVSLHIPVMNQNRFLYYTGYYDAAKK